VHGVSDLGIFHVPGQPDLKAKVDREKTSRYALNACNGHPCSASRSCGFDAPGRRPPVQLWHGTTIVTVRKGGKVVIGGDGQVSIGQTVIKSNARKIPTPRQATRALLRDETPGSD
jgi:hypothetical protein